MATATEKDKVLLRNFLHLVCAVDLASRRSTSTSRAKRFDEHILKYLETLRSVFDHHFVPNHHLSLHLEECLLNFGPVHAWWAFPFERFNGLISRLNTNHKPGALMFLIPINPALIEITLDKMPSTFLRYFYIGAGLRNVIASYHWPDDDAYQRMLVAFRAAFRDQTQGSHTTIPFLTGEGMESESLPYDEKREVVLPRHVYDGILMRVSTPTASSSFQSIYSPTRTRVPRLYDRAVPLSSYKHHGVTYATAEGQLRNSFIVFDHPNPSPSIHSPHFPCAGQISKIFLHGRAADGKRLFEPMFVVDVYEGLSADHARADPYRLYKDLQTRLFYNRFEGSQVVVAIQDIRAHFAAYFYVPAEIPVECIVVRSLDRVSTRPHSS